MLFRSSQRDEALTELNAIGRFAQAVAEREARDGDAFGNCDPNDVEFFLGALQPIPSEAALKGADVAILRHGGV